MSTVDEDLEKAARHLATEARRDAHDADRTVESRAEEIPHVPAPAPAPAPAWPEAHHAQVKSVLSPAAQQKLESAPARSPSHPEPVDLPAPKAHAVTQAPAAQISTPVADAVAPAPAPTRRSVVKAYHQTRHFLLAAALVLAGLYALAFAAPGWLTAAYDPSAFLMVAAAGSLGAFISALLRLFNYRWFAINVSPDHMQTGGLRKLSYSFVPMILGAVAALAFYLLIAGGILRGPVFPEFSCAADGKGCLAVDTLIKHFGPNTAADIAKTMLWCFLAGFCERLLPDLLGNFARAEPTPGAD